MWKKTSWISGNLPPITSQRGSSCRKNLFITNILRAIQWDITQYSIGLMLFLTEIQANSSPPFSRGRRWIRRVPRSLWIPLHKAGIPCAAAAKSFPNPPAGIEPGSAPGFTPGERENPEGGWKVPQLQGSAAGPGPGCSAGSAEDGAGIGVDAGWDWGWSWEWD